MNQQAIELLEPRVLFSGVGELTDANVIDAADYGAIVNDGLDDRAAIQAALDAANGRIVFLADGVYDLSDSLLFDTQNVHLEGESKAGTILRAMSGFAGGSASNSDAVIEMQQDSPVAIGAGFRKTIDNLTVDVGNNNIDGINFFTNNNGGINNIKVVDPFGVGDDGIALTIDNPGPGYNTNVDIEGFRIGIRVSNLIYGSVWEDLSITDSRFKGIRNQNNQFTVRDLTLTGNFGEVGIESSNAAQTTVIGGTISRSSGTGGVAIANFDIGGVEVNTGQLVLRDLNITGFDTALDARDGATQELLLDGDPTNPAGVDISEFFSGLTSTSLFTTTDATLDLPIQDAPVIDTGNAADWINVADYGAIPDDGVDDAAAIQAAIDAADATLGEVTVYLPTGTYNVGSTIVVRGDVRVINGLWSTLSIDAPLKQDPGAAVFRVEGVDGPVRIEQIATTGQDASRQATFIEQADSDPLILRRIVKSISDEGQLAYRNTVEGELYIEDVTGNGWEFNGTNHRVWARQLNAENPEGVTKLTNNGAAVWIMGLKTESSGTVLETNSGGFSEVLGGLVYPTTGSIPPVDQPAFINDESNISIVISEQADGSATIGTYQTVVEETRGGVTLTLANSAATPRGNGWYLNPYVGYTESAPATIDAPGDIDSFTAFTLNGTQAVLHWDKSGRDHDGYTLERRELGSDVWSVVSSQADSRFESYLDDSLVAGTTYLYRVRSFNADGVSAYRVVSVETPAALPAEQARYKLNDGSGTTVADSSGNGNDATTFNDPIFSQTGGLIDGALEFDGVDQQITLTTTSNTGGFMKDGFSERSFSMWVKPDTLSGNRVLIDEGRAVGIAMRINDGVLEGIADASGTALVSADFSGRENQWTHVAMTFNVDTDQGLRLYVDGELVDYAATGFSIGSHGNGSSIGGTTTGDTFGSPGSSGFYDGEIDDVRIYSSMLSGAQVAQLSNRLQQVGVDLDNTPGSVTRSDDTFNVDGSGKFSPNGGFVFAYEQVSSDGSLSAQRLEYGSRQEAGISYRESTSIDSYYVDLVFESSDRVALRYEDASGSGQVSIAIDPDVTSYIRLVRTGDSFEAQTSSDGTTWTTFATQTVDLTDDLLAGLWSNGQDTMFGDLAVLHA